MESIISKIIEIDSIAQQRLNDARDTENDIKEKTDTKISETVENIAQKAQLKVEKIDEVEAEYAQKKIEVITQETQEKIENLEKIYADDHEKIELELFNNVIKAV